MKENVAYMVKSAPETKIGGLFLKKKIMECIKTLEECDFTVRAVEFLGQTDHASGDLCWCGS